MTYASVCSGIEAASVAWEPLGWQTRRGLPGRAALQGVWEQHGRERNEVDREKDSGSGGIKMTRTETLADIAARYPAIPASVAERHWRKSDA
jgi:hypothetical protein